MSQLTEQKPRLRTEVWFWVCALYVAVSLSIVAFVSAVVLFSDDPGFVGVWQLLFVPVTWFAWDMPGATDAENGGGNLAVAQAWTVLFVLATAALGYVAGRAIARAAKV